MYFALSLNKENLSEACPSPDQHLPLGPCQLASRYVFMPACRVSARLFQTFHPHHLPADWSVCRPKSPPVQRAQWSLFWVAKLSGLIAPIGPTSLPDRGECLDRQILAAMHVKTSVCVSSMNTQACKHQHTHTLGPCEELSGRIVSRPEYAKGEDFSCHTACSLGDFDGSNTEGVGSVNVGSLSASLIIGTV